MNTEKFTQRVNTIHGQKYEYVITTTNIPLNDIIEVVCSHHGNFFPRAREHLYNKSGCPTCANESKSNKSQFVMRATKKHGNKYKYTNCKYVNNYTPVHIECRVHGEFEQVPTVHLNAIIGCPKCANESKSSNTDDFIKAAVGRHGYKYKYESVNFINNNRKVEIECSHHGYFLQTPRNHIFNGAGCPHCANFTRSNTFNKGRAGREVGGGTGIIYLALFSSKTEQFIKIGITGNSQGVLSRFGRTHVGYAVEKIYEGEFSMEKAGNMEQKIIEIFREDRFEPSKTFGGYTECFNVEAEERIMKYLKEDKS